jgi:Flp pilus assembly protein TadD
MAYNNRGIVKLGKGDVEGAIADFDRAIKLNPRKPEAYVNRGMVRLQQGRRREADRDFARSIVLNPSVRDFLEKRIAQINTVFGR